MQIKIQRLSDQEYEVVDLEDVGPTYTSDDVIYFNDTPYLLSSAKPYLESFLSKEKKLIIEIMALAYLVQTETKFCVFIDYSGHVDKLEMSIREGKDEGEWQNKVLESEFYATYKDYRKQHPADIAFLEAKKSILESVLASGEIPYDGVEAEQIVSTLYTF